MYTPIWNNISPNDEMYFFSLKGHFASIPIIFFIVATSFRENKRHEAVCTSLPTRGNRGTD